ncbi:unnamed protein product [Bursaphelenchus xylophilus]|uniref:(pine wood nematode) hypothetical protein n=1 Tax=Bursaphelenchus xylophilus TaxID=6326 RepID=A0A1I7SWX5_BURXY|nr:unnamed protein product [Bursaphelenchus xylophilus]CAG9100032.1 unnamed protein product [Bursaphelenchus xylophilus]
MRFLGKITLAIVILNASAFSNLSKNPKVDTNDPRYRFYKCLARCGELFGTPRNVTLASGDAFQDWQLDDIRFDTCKMGCNLGTGFDGTSPKPTESTISDSFGPLEVICVDRLSVTPPRIRAKLNVLTPPQTDNLTLYVIEVYRSLINRNGVVENEFVQRNFSFSPRFVVEHVFSGANPKKEILTFKVFGFTASAEVLSPLCSDDLLLENIYAAQKDPIKLSMREKITMRDSSLVLLTWSAEDLKHPPECDQFVHWTNGQRPNHKMVNLDSSHTVVITDLNDTATYVITAYGRSDAGKDQRPTSKLVLRLNPEAHELIRTELVEFVDSYAIIVGCCVVIILMGLLGICFCIQYKASIRRRERSKAKYDIKAMQARMGYPVKTSTPSSRDENHSNYSFAVNNSSEYITQTPQTPTVTYTQRLPQKHYPAPLRPGILSLTVQPPFEQKDTLC